jgi:hypothetical protein
MSRRRIPAAIWVAAASLLAAIAALAALTARASEELGWAQIAFAALVAALILGGILGRRRLAWLWGHYLSLFLALIQGFALGAALYKGIAFPLGDGLLIGGVVAALLLAFWTLGRRSSLEYFDLLCPACGVPSRMGADFLFRKARCRRCGNVW